MEKDKQVADKQKSWLEEIAEGAGCGVDAVRAFIKRYNIEQTPAVGRPKRINLTGITFSGTKKGEHTNDFEFTFEGLGPGIYGLFTDGNGKGKSTALEIIKWLFKGQSPSTLQIGVKSWLRRACLSFRMDGVDYRIWLEQDSEALNGAIDRSQGEVFSPIREFSTETEMAEVISEFMLDEFEMKEVASNRKGGDELTEDSEVYHGWPALAAAMFIGTDYKAIFGDVQTSGVANRIMNMFMGLPWIPTLAALKTLEGNLNSAAQVQNKHIDWAASNRQKRLKEIITDLADKRDQRAQISEPKTSDRTLHELLDSYNIAYNNAGVSQRNYDESLRVETEVKRVSKEDEVRLRELKEELAANKVFRRLQPKCCPHCDRKVTNGDLLKERNSNSCAVCDHEMIGAEDAQGYLEELRLTADASKKAFEDQRKETRNRESEMHSNQKIKKDLEITISEYKTQLLHDQSNIDALKKINAEIFKLEVLEGEYNTPINENAQSPLASAPITKDIVPTIDENKILKSAIKETETRFRGLQQEILLEVSERMLEFCPKVGLGQYKRLQLGSRPTLTIEKDGLETSYSKVSPGEKLRLKVIALVALISVAESKKLGRHPGFLVIDSPGAQDVAADDLQELIRGLKELNVDLPSLQIIIASKASPVLLDLIAETHRKYAQGKAFLW
ncbi:hypothetical protein [Pedobacter immunditicola]|uniref:hypothetical protein n=1 Tax=Pedobacter immunditicola TaxID=3133440 RepID=UPI0030AF01E7